jgi:hypothetical protein
MYKEFWLYNNEQIKSLEQISNKIEGFIYKITNVETGEYYIGKKAVQSKINKKLGKKEIAAQPIARGRKVTKKQVISESNWLSYYGSSDVLKKQIQEYGKEKFTREILCFAFSKQQLTYLEVVEQIKADVLNDEKALNQSILGKFYKGKV